VKQSAPPADPAARERARRRAQLRASVLRQVLRWHWISAAVSLIGMLMFAITGFTLNHAADIKAEPKVVERTAVLPPDLLDQAKAAAPSGGALPQAVRDWVRKSLKARAPASAKVEWSGEEAFVDLPGPGSDASLTIDLGSGEARYEQTTRGAVAYLNDLHKGRNTGAAWKLFIDVFVVGCIVFCTTGLVLLQLHSWQRRSTWPLVAAGLLIPLLLLIFLVHGV
jgi:hypothetical protein